MAAIPDEDSVLAVTVAVVVEALREDSKKRRRATLPYVVRRHTHGAFHALVQEMANEDPSHLKTFLRMSANTFNDLFHVVVDYITKANTNFKCSIPPEERLAVTLHYLASGGSYSRLFYLFRIPVSTLAYLIPETCSAIYSVLKENYLKFPTTEEEWKAIQLKFMQKWNFPQCLGALDGKHIRIQCPHGSGSAYFNYLKFYSFVLLALVDADYKFVYFDVGTPGRVGDATIWNRSSLKAHLSSNSLKLPPPVLLPGSNTPIPSLIVADSAFALSPNVMKPFIDRNSTQTEKVFNYRLSRARRVVENAFGILASRFAVYQCPMQVQPEKAQTMVLATLALHNFLQERKDAVYCSAQTTDRETGDNHNLVAGTWRASEHANLTSLQTRPGGRRQTSHQGNEIRNALKIYFCGEGALPWQPRLA